MQIQYSLTNIIRHETSFLKHVVLLSVCYFATCPNPDFLAGPVYLLFPVSLQLILSLQQLPDPDHLLFLASQQVMRTNPPHD